MLRLLKAQGDSKAANNANKAASAFTDYFQKEGICQALSRQHITAEEQLLDYCLMGNLQAVLAEYQFLQGPAFVPSLLNTLRQGCDAVKKDRKLLCTFAQRFTPDLRDTGVSGLSPDWCQLHDNSGLRLQRIIPFAPLSQEALAYQELQSIKNYYRRSFGSPNEKIPGSSKVLYGLKLNHIEEKWHSLVGVCPLFY